MAETTYQDRTDSVEKKLRLLQAAYAAGKRDLALSLAESLKDTLTFEKQETAIAHNAEAPTIGRDDFILVKDLPRPWAKWARGWKFCKSVAAFETIGIERGHEPVDVTIAFDANQLTDPQREVRVARIDKGALREVPCQVHSETRHGAERRCRLVFFAQAPMHGRADHLVFYGNANAELPEYVSDLRINGEGYGLDIENHHFRAELSPQMGQLERLTYKRQHGLELYAGGKGHGEPPGIDWGHDYVDTGHFQKLRMRNWPRCPNHEIVRGPLCARVRRWGFPYSPIHPLFTPSRIHMDQTYIFYAGLPYFFKEGRMDAIQDVNIEAMRDDEWVFSGYSFTDTVWIDSRGKLHTGSVPGQHVQNLWGVGFFHRDSRDAFIALWLDHSAENFEGIQHGGVPTLHYPGHGQLWARYPANHAQLRAGTSVRQRNAYVLLPFAEQAPEAVVERLRHTLSNPLEVRSESAPRTDASEGAGQLARVGETEESAPLKPAIWRALRTVRDDQFDSADANVVDMGYVYDVRVRGDVAYVLVTMPHRGRPVHEFLVTQGGGRVNEGIRETLLKLDGVRDVVVDASWNPEWSVARLTDAGRNAMGLPNHGGAQQ